jgi:hypothetical protein
MLFAMLSNREICDYVVNVSAVSSVVQSHQLTKISVSDKE